jgi:hypothetical protein
MRRTTKMTKAEKNGAAANSAGRNPITRLELRTALKHYRCDDSNRATVAQAVKHVFGDDNTGKEFFMDWSGTNTTDWTTATANGQAAMFVVAEAQKVGYSPAAVSAIQEAAKAREKFCIMDAVDDLEKQLPPMIAVGHEFWWYAEGAWNRLEWDSLRTAALSVVPRQHQNNKTAEEVLRTLDPIQA